jgi:hypothetical protein
MAAVATATTEIAPKAVWPEPLVDSFDVQWPNLTVDEEVRKWVHTNKIVLVRTVTWNLCANPPPATGDVTKTLLPRDRLEESMLWSWCDHA